MMMSTLDKPRNVLILLKHHEVRLFSVIIEHRTCNDDSFVGVKAACKEAGENQL
jgi:hypothetical protein